MLFEQYWHLTRNPFDKALPARDAFSTRDFREATSRLDFLARAGGIGLVTAPPGAGKTYVSGNFLAYCRHPLAVRP